MLERAARSATKRAERSARLATMGDDRTLRVLGREIERGARNEPREEPQPKPRSRLTPEERRERRRARKRRRRQKLREAAGRPSMAEIVRAAVERRAARAAAGRARAAAYNTALSAAAKARREQREREREECYRRGGRIVPTCFVSPEEKRFFEALKRGSRKIYARSVWAERWHRKKALFAEARRRRRAARITAGWKPKKRKLTREQKRFARIRRRARKRAVIRESITAKLWARIIEAWGCRCAYCGELCAAPDMEHFVPLSRGGAHTRYNLVPACRGCNSAKGDKDPFVFLHDRGVRKITQKYFSCSQHKTALLCAIDCAR